MAATIAEYVKNNILLIDGAMGTTLQSCGCDLHRDYLDKENCSEVLLKTRPQTIREIHELFFDAGAHAVETNTFGANRLVLSEFDLAEETYDLNLLAVRLAREAADKFATSEQPRFVLGSMGPGTKLISLGQTNWDEMHDSYLLQARGLIDGGCDALLIETCQDLLQVKCALSAALDALHNAGKTPDDIPLMVSVTVETTGTLLVGSDLGAVMAALSGYPLMSLGLNCATGPEEMTEHVHRLLNHWPGTVSVVPNAGLPTLVDGQTVYPLAPDRFAELVGEFVDLGAGIVGGCCGTTAEHIRKLAETIRDKKPVSRSHVQPPRAVSSLYSAVELKQDTSILLIGERTNANGSRKFKRLLNKEDWDGLVSIARQQVKEGSHAIDVCVDFVGRDGVKDMTELVSRIVRQVDCPLMLDSTDPAVIEAGLKLAPGKCIVNSINLENGESRFEDICPLLQRFGAAAVALTIDEDPQEGMAKTAARKLEIAARIHRLFTEKWHCDSRDLLFDPLTFTTCTGNDDDRRLALETLNAIEMIAKHFPECGILLGISNVSFGLRPAARVVLNSAFMHEAIQRGLTAAIVHASGILPRTRISDERWQAALDLIYDRRTENRDPLLHFISLFPEGESSSTSAEEMKALPIEEQLQRHIIDGEKEGLTEHLQTALQKYSPLEIINDHLLAGMKVVGELFGSGALQLPFVLQSAEVMKMAVTHLEPHMQKSDTGNKGTIILATVRGDVHDIGKNLVDIILTNNGYKVVNLGIKQQINAIVDAFREHEADAIGLSGLLVKSVNVMEENLRELNALNITTPVLLGGAALTRKYCETHLRSIYNGNVYYGKDAFEGLHLMNKITGGKTNEINRDIEKRTAGKTTASTASAEPDAGNTEAVKVQVKSSVTDAVDIPRPPFTGTKVVNDIDPEEIYPFINKIALFRGQWGFRRGSLSDEQYSAIIREKAEPVFERLQKTCRENSILQPHVVYGYFRCRSEGDSLIIYDPADDKTEIERFTFPRQQKGKHLCIADYFRSVDSDEPDTIAMTCVTVGSEISRRAKELFETDNYSEYLYLHGFGVEAAEALAEYWHKRIREELDIADQDAREIRKLFAQHYRGCRYSFGYPACPDMEDQVRLFRLLRPERIGCSLSEQFQIHPEQSTSALVVHHPQAGYFTI